MCSGGNLIITAHQATLMDHCIDGTILILAVAQNNYSGNQSSLHGSTLAPIVASQPTRLITSEQKQKVAKRQETTWFMLRKL